MFEGKQGENVTIRSTIESCQITSSRKYGSTSGGWGFLNSAMRKLNFLKQTYQSLYIQMSIVISFKRVLLGDFILRAKILLLLGIFVHASLGFSLNCLVCN